MIRPYCVSTLYYCEEGGRGGGWETIEGKGGLSERIKYGEKQQVKEKAVKPGI